MGTLNRTARRRLKKLANENPMILSILDTRFKEPAWTELPDGRTMIVQRGNNGRLLPLAVVYGKPTGRVSRTPQAQA